MLSNTGTRTGVEVALSLSETVGVPVPTVNVITARDLMLGAMVDVGVSYDRFVVVEDRGSACPPPLSDAASSATRASSRVTSPT